MANGANSSRCDRRVGPEPGSCDNIIEIRPKRTVRIKHVNPKARDEKFEKEMQAYLQYRENAVIGMQIPAHIKAQRQKSNVHMVNNSQASTAETHAPNTVEVNDERLHQSAEEIRSKSDLVQGDKNQHREGWIETIGNNNSQNNASEGTLNVQSPSRLSVQSQSAQSVSGVQVDVTRPSSLIRPLKGINEKKEEVLTNGVNKMESILSESQLPHSPRKTKDHRPVSARSIKRGARSVASNDAEEIHNIPNLNLSTRSHLDSSFREVTIFFIHGVGGSADIWNPQIDFFSMLGLEVIAADLLGHGMSQCPDVPHMYHFNEILADVEATFDKYCKRQNVVIGHSYGCAFAAALGRRRARRVSKLVLISGGAPIPLAPQPGVFSLPVCMLSCIKPCLFSRFERNAFHDREQSGLSREQAFDLPVYVLSHMMLGQDWLDGDELYHQWLTSPTLLLHGKYDNFVTLQEEEEMEKTIHLSQLVVIDNASHMVMMEAPDDVNQALYEFIFQDTHEPHDPDRSKSRISSAKSARSARTKLSKSLA